MCPSQCPGNNCQSSRELQITSNRDLHQPLQPPQQRHGNGNKEAAAKRRRAFAKSGHCETVETRVVRFDAEEAAEVAILSRDCMKHLGDWYYPEGGWGWVVFLSSLFISMLSLGLVICLPPQEALGLLVLHLPRQLAPVLLLVLLLRHHSGY